MSEPDEANKAKRRRRRRSLRVPVDEVPRPTQAVAESVEVPLEAEGGMTVEMPASSDDASPSLAGPPTIDGDSANEFDEPRTIVEAEGAAEALGAGARRGPMRGYYYQLMALSGWTSLPLLPAITADTLIIAGDDDPIVPRGNATMLHRGIRRSRISRYPGGHLELLLDPEPFAAEIDAFLRS